jgi:hypothetical protein
MNTPTLAFSDQLRIKHDLNHHASRAIGILRGRFLPDLERMPRGFIVEIIEEQDKSVTRIPGVLLNQARDQFMKNPALMGQMVDLMVYPRTVKKALTIQAVQIAPATGRFNPDQDFFYVTGTRMQIRTEGMVKLAIRPNRSKKQMKHNFEPFWIEAYGHLNGEKEGAYLTKMVRRGNRLFVVESQPRPTGKTNARTVRTASNLRRVDSAAKDAAKSPDR